MNVFLKGDPKCYDKLHNILFKFVATAFTWPDMFYQTWRQWPPVVQSALLTQLDSYHDSQNEIMYLHNSQSEYHGQSFEQYISMI